MKQDARAFIPEGSKLWLDQSRLPPVGGFRFSPLARLSLSELLGVHVLFPVPQYRFIMRSVPQTVDSRILKNSSSSPPAPNEIPAKYSAKSARVT